MTKFRLLALQPLLFAVGVTILARFDPKWSLGALVVGDLQVVVAALVAALSFSRRDRLRWAWLCFSIAYVFTVPVQLFSVSIATSGTASRAASEALGMVNIASNALSIAGLVLFARVWNGTGLVPAWRRYVTVLALFVALAVNGRVVVANVTGLVHGSAMALNDLASTVGDIICVTLIGPVLVTAVAMRGGLFLWPWAFLFLSSFVWLTYDAALQLHVSRTAGVVPFLIALATQFIFVAAVSQRWVKSTVAAD